MGKGVPKFRRAWRDDDSGLQWTAALPSAQPSPAISGQWRVPGEKFVCALFPGFARVGVWLPVDFLPSDRSPAALVCSSPSAPWNVYCRAADKIFKRWKTHDSPALEPKCGSAGLLNQKLPFHSTLTLQMSWVVLCRPVNMTVLVLPCFCCLSSQKYFTESFARGILCWL